MADFTFSAPQATVGATYTWPIAIIDPTTNLPPVPDITNYAAIDVEVRQQPTSAILLQATLSNGQITLGPSGTGLLTVAFSAAAIANAGSYTYEIKFTDSAGAVSKPFGGQFAVVPTYTS